MIIENTRKDFTTPLKTKVDSIDISSPKKINENSVEEPKLNFFKSIPIFKNIPTLEIGKKEVDNLAE